MKNTSDDKRQSLGVPRAAVVHRLFTPYFTALISGFQKAHPGTTVNWIDQPGANYPDKITSQVTSGSLPDVVNLGRRTSRTPRPRPATCST